jgi:hypothetical protein
VKLTNHLHLVPTLKESVGLPPRLPRKSARRVSTEQLLVLGRDLFSRNETNSWLVSGCCGPALRATRLCAPAEQYTLRERGNFSDRSVLRGTNKVAMQAKLEDRLHSEPCPSDKIKGENACKYTYRKRQ